METGSLSANKSRVYDFIKVFDELLVVLLHITAMYSPHAAIAQASSSRPLSLLYSCLAAACMPVFMCICGAVYNYCISIGKYRDRLRFIGNKFMRLMVPYFVFSIFTVAPVVTRLGISEWSYGEFLLRGTLLGGMTRHLWFCLSLFCIFIICAVFRDSVQRLSPLIILPIVCVLSYVGSRWSSPYLQLHQTLYFTLYFYIGVLVDRYWDNFSAFIRKYRFICAAAGIILFLSIALIDNYRYPAAFGAIILAFTVSAQINTDKPETFGIYRMLRRDSFGIYLTHPMIIYVIFWLFRSTHADPYILSAVCFICVIPLTVLITEIIRKLRLGVIIGEKTKKAHTDRKKA